MSDYYYGSTAGSTPSSSTWSLAAAFRRSS